MDKQFCYRFCRKSSVSPDTGSSTVDPPLGTEAEAGSGAVVVGAEAGATEVKAGESIQAGATGDGGGAPAELRHRDGGFPPCSRPLQPPPPLLARCCRCRRRLLSPSSVLLPPLSFLCSRFLCGLEGKAPYAYTVFDEMFIRYDLLFSSHFRRPFEDQWIIRR